MTRRPFSQLWLHERIIYYSGVGNTFSARVIRRHRTGEITVKLSFMLDAWGREVGPYQGDVFRITERNYMGSFPVKVSA